MKQMWRALVQMLVVVGLCACSPLHTFNALMPKDPGVQRIANVAYGTGPRQTMDLYRPAQRSATSLPVIVFLYGGSWNSGDRQGYEFVGRALAAKGFLVAIPDYRLVPQVHYPAFLQDNAAAVRWIAQHAGDYGGQPGRVVLVGHSAGAYNAAMVAMDPRWLGADRALVRGFVGLAGPYDFAPFVDKTVEETFAGVADQASTQPIAYAGAGSPPALLATGDRDTVVRPRNSDALARALRANGVRVERLTYPRVGHAGLITAFAAPLRSHAEILDATAAFARTCLAP
ncbi:alpha/beta hydrolase [Novosphingobium acidiphilum]|uniref:alpha/beta hydrolase n=1 Tax=Novosphingobium acidiphilum TaxID=505248 RepID=UPI000410ACAD|nr:alpha/beta hydrolase [Novosphingobium acidiphilum]